MEGRVERHLDVVEDHRDRQLLGEVDRGALPVQLAGLGIRADEAVQVARFEFVGVARQGFEVTDAVVACTRIEDAAERQSA